MDWCDILFAILAVLRWWVCAALGVFCFVWWFLGYFGGLITVLFGFTLCLLCVKVLVGCLSLGCIGVSGFLVWVCAAWLLVWLDVSWWASVV